jgi:Core-2/I-Branching enzyme
MHIAYIIIAYKNFQQVERLIKRLSDPQSHFIVAVDSKAPKAEYEAFRQKMDGCSRVRFTLRHPIRWGHFSLTYANIIGIRELLKLRIPFDYVFSLSGQDYPLVASEEIRRVLDVAEGRSFLEHYPFEQWIDGAKGRLYSWNFFLPGRRVIQLPKATPASSWILRILYGTLAPFVRSRGPLPGGLHPFGGSMHWTLSREAAEYVDRYVEEHPEYVRRFQFTLISDEIFTQTILANSPLRDKLINDDQRYTRWPGSHCPSPVVLTMPDLPLLMKSGKLFGRKFDVTLDSHILDAIDARAGHATLKPAG